ncbi:succinylglutamate desuccinylase/aspartoacylase family protein [Halobacterium litoreum]|uniref:Succinylglutamate desuccinylase/aspartoacylase family protein n=1 Tax=Halobacterium litoreum TaxID=2039234 RepID=A0ABD5NBC8_9EURY|nr:succinylglutamate desuccinylase/aspartoacylase family protein [Halobacterium litoreum]UHH14537.1 succinylglutamate desuccinylase/aspartoacylase family protein [Halobacterium litoreum]
MSVDAFTYDGGRVESGETQRIRYTVSETYLGDPIRIPVTVVNGDDPGPTVFLSAAAHGDELNGIAVVREVAREWDHGDVRGTLVCLPVLNVQGFLTQQRYLPVYDRDLNRSFPGNRRGTSARRVAAAIFENFVRPCDLGLDFHTSTRGRTNMLHVRADMDDDPTARLAQAFGASVVVAGAGEPGMLRREATERGVPTVTVELGEAHRFERALIDRALDGVRSVFAEYGVFPQETVRWPGWRTVIRSADEKTWLRADVGGIAEMQCERGDLVYEGDAVCAITNPFRDDVATVTAPFTGLLVGSLENPVVYPGNPLCHLVELDDRTRRVIESRRGRSPPEEDSIS